VAEQPAPQWFKSSYSGAPNNECVECATMTHAVLVRDSTDPDGPRLSFSHQAWTDFLHAVDTQTLRRS
jgi:hypothetical protein